MATPFVSHLHGLNLDASSSRPFCHIPRVCLLLDTFWADFHGFINYDFLSGGQYLITVSLSSRLFCPMVIVSLIYRRYVPQAFKVDKSDLSMVKALLANTQHLIVQPRINSQKKNNDEEDIKTVVTTKTMSSV